MPKLVIEVLGDTSKLERSFRRARGEVDSFGRGIGNLRVGIGQLAKATLVVDAVASSIRGVTRAVGSGIDEWKEQQQVAAQTAAVLASTGSAANVTAQHVDELAASISGLSGIDDEAVQAGENLLLTFTKVRNYAGPMNDVFDQATRVIADVSVAMKTDMSTAAIQVGKALNDPIRGVGQLRRVGVSFTAAQRDQIKALVESGRTLEAQKIVLRELRTEFGGSAEAAGKTLPGQLKILRETLNNVAGDVVGTVVPAFTAGIQGLNRFAGRLQDAKGTRAKFQVVVEGAEDLGRRAFEAWESYERALISAIRGTNWAAVGSTIADGLRRAFDSVRTAAQDVDWSGIARSIGERLRSIRWAHYIEVVAHALSRALVSVLNGLGAVIRRVNWNTLGRRIVDGIAIAIAAVVKFLASLDWVGIAKAIVRLSLAAIKGIGDLFAGIGTEIGRLIMRGLSAGLDALGRVVERKALSIALKIVEPFTHLPSWLGGGPFQALKKTFEEKLAALEEPAQVAAKTVGQSIGAGLVEGIRDYDPAVEAQMKATVGKALTAAQTAAATEVALPPPPKEDGTGGRTTKGGPTLAERRNTYFDTAITRMLDRVQDLPIKQQIAKLREIRGLIEQRIAVTKDVTRRLNLEDRVIEINRTIASTRAGIVTAAQTLFDSSISRAIQRAGTITNLDRQLAAYKAIADRLQKRIDATKDLARKRALEDALSGVLGQVTTTRQAIAARIFDRLQFGIDKAAVTARLSDDLAAWEAYRRAVVERIRTQGATLDLERQSLTASQNIASIKKQQADQRLALVQFGIDRAGLTASLVDDLKAWQAYQRAVEARIKVEGKTLELEKASLDAQTSIATIRKQQRENAETARRARLFRQLGLTATGEERVAGVRTLAAELRKVDALIDSGVLKLSTNMRNRLAAAGRILKQGDPGRDVRAAIAQMVDPILNGAKKADADWTTFRAVNTKQILQMAGLGGLSGAARNRLQGVLAGLGPGMTVAPRTSLAFAGQGGTTIHIANLHTNANNAAALENDLTKRAKQRPARRRGS